MEDGKRMEIEDGDGLRGWRWMKRMDEWVRVKVRVRDRVLDIKVRWKWKEDENG